MTNQLEAGDRIRLILMADDPDPIAAGTSGAVASMYSHGDWTQVDIEWDNGRSLMLTFPPDVVERIEPPKDAQSC